MPGMTALPTTYPRSCSKSEPARDPADEMPVAGIPQRPHRVRRRYPQGAVTGLGRGAARPDRIGKVDRADLLGPEIVLRHEGEPAKRAETARPRDGPARLLSHLAKERAQR